MDRGKGTSRQKTPSPQQYPISRTHLLSVLQVRGSKNNPRTCPELTLETTQGRSLLTGTGESIGAIWLSG